MRQAATYLSNTPNPLSKESKKHFFRLSVSLDMLHLVRGYCALYCAEGPQSKAQALILCTCPSRPICQELE